MNLLLLLPFPHPWYALHCPSDLLLLLLLLLLVPCRHA
jgi:hypothetical protein